MHLDFMSESADIIYNYYSNSIWHRYIVKNVLNHKTYGREMALGQKYKFYQRWLHCCEVTRLYSEKNTNLGPACALGGRCFSWWCKILCNKIVFIQIFSVWISRAWHAFKPIWEEVPLVHVLKLQGQIPKEKKKYKKKYLRTHKLF